jgi:hypothetical protein
VAHFHQRSQASQRGAKHIAMRCKAEASAVSRIEVRKSTADRYIEPHKSLEERTESREGQP